MDLDTIQVLWSYVNHVLVSKELIMLWTYFLISPEAKGNKLTMPK